MAELAVKELIQAAVIDPAALANAAAEQQVGLHQPANAEPLTAGDALLWYSSLHLVRHCVVCRRDCQPACVEWGYAPAVMQHSTIGQVEATAESATSASVPMSSP